MAIDKMRIAALAEQYISTISDLSNVSVQVRPYHHALELIVTVPAGCTDELDPLELECLLASDPEIGDVEDMLITVEEDKPFQDDDDNFAFRQMNMDRDDEEDDDGLHEIVFDPYAMGTEDDDDDTAEDIDAEFDEMADDDAELYAAMNIREDEIPEEDRAEFEDLGDY